MAEDPVADFLEEEKRIFEEIDGNGANDFITSDFVRDNANSNILLNGDVFNGEEQNNLGALQGDLGFSDGEQQGIPDNRSPLPPQPIIDTPQLQEWRRQFEIRITTKDANESVATQEWEQKGKDELEQWYKTYNEQLGAKRSTNRKNQESEITDSNTKLYSGVVPNVNDAAVWNRVYNMCNFNNKAGKTSNDPNRMRSIMITLKNDATEA